MTRFSNSSEKKLNLYESTTRLGDSEKITALFKNFAIPLRWWTTLKNYIRIHVVFGICCKILYKLYINILFHNNSYHAAKIHHNPKYQHYNYPGQQILLQSRNFTRITKSNLFKTPFRLVLSYGRQCWELTKYSERVLDILEGRILRSIFGKYGVWLIKLYQLFKKPKPRQGIYYIGMVLVNWIASGSPWDSSRVVMSMSMMMIVD